MRRIGTLTGETTSKRFCDFLQTQSIEASAGSSDNASAPKVTEHDIWIRHEFDVDQARELLAQYRSDPDNAKYDVSSQAERIRREKSDQIAQKLKMQKKSQMKLRSGSGRGVGGLGSGNSLRTIPVTIAIIAIATLAAFATSFGDPETLRPGEGFSTQEQIFFGLSCVDVPSYIETGDALISLKRGEIWRLFTPMFLHGGTMHLAFNMINLFILGGVVERIHGSGFYVILVLVCQAVATLTQILMPDAWGSPLAIGASGAVFGVFGFVWIRPKVQMNYPIEIPSFNVKFMLGFLVLCMTPLIPGIANGAHVGGLLAGIAIAYVAPGK